MKIYDPPTEIDLSKCILWQYENAERLKQIIRMFQDATNMCSLDLWNNVSTMFDIRNPIDESDAEQVRIRTIGLNELSLLFGITRPSYTLDGEVKLASLNVWRRYIQGMILLMDSDGSATDIAEWARTVFPNIIPFGVIDIISSPMEIAYTYSIDSLSDEDKTLISIPGFLPHPAGVLIGDAEDLTYGKLGFVISDPDTSDPDNLIYPRSPLNHAIFEDKENKDL